MHVRARLCVNFPELPLTRLASDVHGATAKAGPSEGQDYSLFSALATRNSLLTELDGFFGELETSLVGA
jgi:hypothetical protein